MAAKVVAESCLLPFRGVPGSRQSMTGRGKGEGFTVHRIQICTLPQGPSGAYWLLLLSHVKQVHP